MNKETRIEFAPTPAEIARLVDRVITPEEADEESLALIKIILAVANFENPFQDDLARAVMNRAYSKTLHCQYAIREGFEDFIGQREISIPEKGSFEQAESNEEGDYPVVG